MIQELIVIPEVLSVVVLDEVAPNKYLAIVDQETTFLTLAQLQAFRALNRSYQRGSYVA